MDAAARHLRPWRRGPYVAVLLVVFFVLLGWVVVALASLGRPDTGYLCPLVCTGLALVVIGLPLAIRRRRGISRAHRSFVSNDDALALHRMGRYQEAADAWNDLCHQARHSPAVHGLDLINLATASLHLGRLDFARTLLERARASGWLGATVLRHVRPSTDASLALTLALSGELAEARRIALALDATLSAARRPLTRLVHAVIDAREGREVSFDDDALREAEGSLTNAHIRALRLLQAFTRARADAAYRESAAALDLDVRPGELDFLAVSWPELRAFMQARGLVKST